MIAEPHLIDSNIIVYAYSEESAKWVVARDIVDDAFDSHQGMVSVQNVAEFTRVALEKFKRPLSVEQTVRLVSQLARCLPVLKYGPDTIARAAEIRAEYGIHFFDALLVATMREHHLATIVTENEKDFRKIPGLTVVNPFKTATRGVKG